MIELLLFHLHIAGALYAFTKNWQSRGVKAGLLAIVQIGLVFSIGWAMTGTLAYLIWPKAWTTVYFSSDTLSLVLLAIPEYFFFKAFFLTDEMTSEEERINMENLNS